MTHIAHATAATPAAARFATLSSHEAALLQTLYRQIGGFTALRIQGEYVGADAVQDLLDTGNRESSTFRALIDQAFTQYNCHADMPDDVLLTDLHPVSPPLDDLCTGRPAGHGRIHHARPCEQQDHRRFGNRSPVLGDPYRE